ncbi:MAG: ABC transporter ATP-binding protein [Gemmatimonadota bacterium]|nr:ABC transporter ATP-binding protein [Gemmatimonadota bacterium]MDE2806172.1 ABC transporter ATP-binding protein [Gemmatimonadota bacterium]
MPVIETTELTKRFPAVLAVDRVSLTVEQGQIFGFLGPNGSGKTTTIGMLMGIIKPTAGSFRLFGAGAPRELLAARARVGATLETPNFYPYLSGRDNLRIAAAIKGIGKARIEECLDIVGLRGRGKHRFRTYSLGMKQRLALAATMLNDPELIVLDEPANGLDPKGMKEVRNIIRLLADRGKTIFLSSHLLWEVERTCTHVSIVRKGRVVGTGTVAEIVGGEITAVVRAEDDDLLRAALEAFPEATSVRASDDGLVVALASDDLAALNRYLAGQGIYVSHLARRHRSLEDAFMDLTGEDEGAGQASLTEFAS